MDMQIVSFTGEVGTPTAMQAGTDKHYIEQAISRSGEDDGCVVILGTALDSQDVSERCINVVAVNGTLANRNIGPN